MSAFWALRWLTISDTAILRLIIVMLAAVDRMPLVHKRLLPVPVKWYYAIAARLVTIWQPGRFNRVSAIQATANSHQRPYPSVMPLRAEVRPQ